MKRTLRRTIIPLALIAIASTTSSTRVDAQEEKPSYTIIKNVNIFDGVHDRLTPGSVLIENNLIKSVGADVQAPKGATIIDGGGRTLMPGLIESHVHLNLQHMIGGYDTVELRDWQEIGAMAAGVARGLLMDGFTTIRDPGTLQAGMRRAIERGDIIGPRIYNSGAVITQTSGHGDFRLRGQTTLESRYTFKGARLGFAHIIDGYDATLSAARQNLANGAVFNKMMMGGGIFSSRDPLHTKQSTDDEIRAVVEASAAWDTYTTAHIFLPEHARRAIGLGMKEILHIPFLDEKTAKLMVEKGIFYNPQLSQSTPEALEATFGPKESVNKSKARVTQQAMAMTTKILQRVPELLETTTFGVDIVTNTPANARRMRDHEMWFWADRFGTFPTLKCMTFNGGRLAALTGKLNPYPDGPLGVIKEGAYADILLVDGNPLEDITVLGGSELMFKAPGRKAGEITTMRLIMKDGKIYKNTLR